MESGLKKRTASSLFWAIMNNGTMQVLNACFGIVLGRLLTREDYGLIGMMMIFTAIATSLQDSGFVTALTNRRDASHKDYNSVFWFNILMSIFLYALFFLCAPLIAQFYNEPILTSLFRYYSLSFLVASFSIVPRSLLFRQLRQKEIAVMSLVSLIVSGGIGILMALSGMAYWGLATQSIVFTLMVTLFSWWFSGWKPSFYITFKPVKEMFAFSSKMLLTSIFTQINNNIFSFILGKLYTKSEVGTYNQANKWNMMGAYTIIGMVQGVAQPLFVQVGTDPERLRHVFSKMLRFTSFITFPTMLGLALVAPELIVILITDKWLPSAYLMRVLCIAGAFIPITTLFQNMVISRGRSDLFMWNTIAQGLSLLLAIILIHALGGNIMLMMYAYVSIIFLWLCIWNHLVRREIGITLMQTLRDILPFLFISAMTMLATYFITITIENLYILLATRILLAASIYLISMWLLGAKILKECLSYIFHKH